MKEHEIINEIHRKIRSFISTTMEQPKYLIVDNETYDDIRKYCEEFLPSYKTKHCGGSNDSVAGLTIAVVIHSDGHLMEVR